MPELLVIRIEIPVLEIKDKELRAGFDPVIRGSAAPLTYHELDAAHAAEHLVSRSFGAVFDIEMRDVCAFGDETVVCCDQSQA